MKLFLGAIWKESVPVMADEHNTLTGQIGVVAKKSDGDESWKAYIGVTLNPQTEQKDIDTIIERGIPLTEDEARKWFPDIELKYRQ